MRITWGSARAERDAEVKRRWLKGETARQIAEAMDATSRMAVLGVVHRLKQMDDTIGNRHGLPTTIKPRPAPKPNAAKKPKADPKPKAVGSWGLGAAREPIAPALTLVQTAEAATGEGLKTLAERGQRECCWPVGKADPKRGQLYCARPTGPRQSYCPDHNPRQPTPLREVRLRDETVRRDRRVRDDEIAPLTEMFA